MASTILQKRMGTAGPLVPTIGYGAMGLSAFYGPVGSDAERLALLDRAHALGARHWDTSDLYGDSEELLGRWFQRSGKRDDIFLATKFGGIVGSDGAVRVRSDPAYVREACERCLRRLGVECIDLFYCHRLDEKTPIEYTVRAMVELKNEGKIKHIGISELSARSLRRAHAVHPITAIQMEYSPFETAIESPATNLLATCRELGVALVAYCPLGRGFITGRYTSPADFADDDFRRLAPRYQGENFEKNLVLVRKFEEMARGKGCTAGQLCLAWLLAQGEDIFLIPGYVWHVRMEMFEGVPLMVSSTKRVKYLEENVGAAEVRLSEDEVAQLRKLVDEAEVHGERAPPA